MANHITQEQRYIKKIKSLPQSFSTLKDIFDLAVSINDEESVRWVRKEAMKIPNKECYGLVRDTYFHLGQYYFDDYLIGCEWNRPDTAQFYLPRRKVLEGSHHLVSIIQNFMDSDKRYLSISLPPGTGKTTLIKFLLAFIIGKYPHSYNMYCSYSDAMTKTAYDAVKDIICSDEYCHRYIFNADEPYCSAEYKTISYNSDGDAPTLGLTSIGGSVTGRTRASMFLVLDDTVKDSDESSSPSRMQKLNDFLNETIRSRKLSTAKEIQLGTRWSIHDPICTMEIRHENDPQYQFVAIPVCDENGHSNFLYDHWSAYTDEFIAQLKKDLNPARFSALYMQKGIQEAGMRFTNLKYYNGILPSGGSYIGVCDVAWGGGDNLSFITAYVVNDDVYIVDVIYDNHDKSITKPRVANIIQKYGVYKARFEGNLGGDEYADDINSILRSRGYACAISSKKASNKKSKIQKIEQFQDDILNFYYLEPALQSREYQLFIQDLKSFSFTGKNLHDDAPDSLAQLADYLLKPKSAKAIKPIF